MLKHSFATLHRTCCKPRRAALRANMPLAAEDRLLMVVDKQQLIYPLGLVLVSSGSQRLARTAKREQGKFQQKGKAMLT